jgi:hypothetical protein
VASLFQKESRVFEKYPQLNSEEASMMNRRSLFGFLAVAPVALPAAIAAREAERGVIYLDGERVSAIIAEQLARDPAALTCADSH